MFRNAMHVTYRIARRIAVIVVGSTVLLVGIALIVRDLHVQREGRPEGAAGQDQRGNGRLRQRRRL